MRVDIGDVSRLATVLVMLWGCGSSDAGPGGGGAGGPQDASVEADAPEQADATPEDAGQADADADTGPDAFVPACGSVEVPTAECAACLDEACCEDVTACAGDAVCADFVECVLACAAEDEPCRETCATMPLDPEARHRVLLACARKNCLEECSEPSDGKCGSRLSDPTCGACGMEECCDLQYEATHEPDYWQFYGCIATCSVTDDVCLSACAAAHPAGYARNSVFNDCLARSCGTACFGRDYPCGLYSTQEAACGTCLEQNCCEASQEYSESLEAWAYDACLAGCPDCQQQCVRDNPGGASLSFRITACGVDRCGQECDNPYADGTSCAATVFFPPACHTCMKDNCCDPTSVAEPELEYWQFMECHNFQCDDTDAACQTQCEVDNPDGWAYNSLIWSCMGTSCATDCSIVTPATCGAPIDPAATSCKACIEQSCCTEVEACWSDIECLKYQTCLAANECGTDAACISACAAHAPAGVAPSEASDACLVQSCATECEIEP